MTYFPFLFVAALYSLNPVTLSIHPPASMAPATFRITVLVPRHLDNRKICYGVDGPELKNSCFTLDGWQARRTWTVYWSLRVAGEYEATADLLRIEGGKEKHYVQRQAFRVVGFEPEP